MPISKSLIWVDIGMALFVAAFAVIFVFVGRGLFAPIMIGYMVALTIWAFVVESAIVQSESHETFGADRTLGNAGTTNPLPH